MLFFLAVSGPEPFSHACPSYHSFFLLAMLPASAQLAPTEAELRAYSGLHAAAARGDLVEIEKRIASGENKEATDSRHRTPLHVATYQKQHDAARMLIRLGADPNKLEADRYDIITIAAVANDVPMLKIALEGGGNPKAITSRYDGTALIAAAHLGHAEVVRTLIAAKAPLDHVNNLQWTALIYVDRARRWWQQPHRDFAGPGQWRR